MRRILPRPFITIIGTNHSNHFTLTLCFPRECWALLNTLVIINWQSIRGILQTKFKQTDCHLTIPPSGNEKFVKPHYPQLNKFVYFYILCHQIELLQILKENVSTCQFLWVYLRLQTRAIKIFAFSLRYTAILSLDSKCVCVYVFHTMKLVHSPVEIIRKGTLQFWVLMVLKCLHCSSGSWRC